MKNIILWGAGNRGKVLVQLMDMCNMPITAIVDSNSRLWGKKLGKNKIESPDILCNKDGLNLCITAAAPLVIEEIREKIKAEYNENINELSYLELIMTVYEKINIDSLLQIQSPHKADIKSGKFSILFDCAYGLVLGGIEEWTKGISSEFIKRKEYTPYILTNYGDYQIPDELKSNILRVDVNKDMSFSVQNVSRIMNCIAAHLPCILVTSKPEDALLAGKLIRKKYNNAIRIVSGIRGGSSEIYQNYIDMKFCTDVYVCVSSDIRKNMIEKGVDPKKIFTMICPIECPENLVRDYAIDVQKPLRLGYAGRLMVEQKRMDLMVKLISELENMHVNYNFEFAGEGDYAPMLQEAINQMGCQNRVKLIGKIDNSQIPQFWQQKDICINLADYEGRSRSIAEAMANGAIPIVTATSGVNDDISNDKNGYIVNIGDYKAIAERVFCLAHKRDKLSQMGNAAYLELKTKSSMDKHYQFWQNIISIATNSCT